MLDESGARAERPGLRAALDYARRRRAVDLEC
jgi:hypothetical protein